MIVHVRCAVGCVCCEASGARAFRASARSLQVYSFTVRFITEQNYALFFLLVEPVPCAGTSDGRPAPHAQRSGQQRTHAHAHRTGRTLARPRPTRHAPDRAYTGVIGIRSSAAPSCRKQAIKILFKLKRAREKVVAGQICGTLRADAATCDNFPHSAATCHDPRGNVASGPERPSLSGFDTLDAGAHVEHGLSVGF